MKKLITLVLVITFIYSCSTNTDSNGNTTAVPVSPSNLTGTVASNTQINLSWTDNSTNETGFKIERKTGTGTFAPVGTTTTNVTTFNDTGLSSFTTYTYRVYSYNSTGISPTYSNEITLTTTSDTQLMDVEGNIYPLVTICNQKWMQTNLTVSKYRNGDVIPQVVSLNQLTSITTGGWAYYAFNSTNGTIYGKLYNSYAINDPRGLAPVGFHIPTQTEWNSLINCLDPNPVTTGGALSQVAGGYLKDTGLTYWNPSNVGATNSSGFKALPGGCISTDVVTAFPAQQNGLFWASVGLGIWLSNSSAKVFTTAGGVKMYSVRCLKD